MKQDIKKNKNYIYEKTNLNNENKENITWFLKPNLNTNLCKPYGFKDSETHNKINDKPKKLKVKFGINKPWLRDNNLILKNQWYWKLNLDPWIIDN